MNPADFASQIRMQREWFERATRCFSEEHSGFAPKPGMMTVAQQVAHAAHTIDWFRVGAFRPEGFDMDFESHAKEVAAVTSLAEARTWFSNATDELANFIAGRTVEELTAPIVPGVVMGGAMRVAIVGALADHSAHHRGALTVYARLLGLAPAMPYMEM